MGISLSSLINIFMQMEPDRTYFFNKKTGNVISISAKNMSKQDMTILSDIKENSDSWLFDSDWNYSSINGKSIAFFYCRSRL